MKRIAAALAASIALSASALAAPFTPQRDDVVLETLPESASPLAPELAVERRALERATQDLGRATRFAWRAIAASRAESDPRYVGLAEGALAPWLASERPPAEVLLLRATLRQNRHDFAGAQEDLDALLARDPRSAQAWLTRAVIARVRGDFALARQSCVPLIQLADSLTATTCLAEVAGLNGRARAAEGGLARALARAPRADAPLRQWALVALAELRERLGDAQGAEASYRDALALGRDGYSLAAYADFLLDEARPRDVIELLASEQRTDGLLLRRALAQRQLEAPELAATLRELRARFAASRLRGERLHAGEEARFTLAFGDAREALALARENFQLQREPRDARVMLEAALAARDGAAAKPALDLLGSSRLEDARLQSLAARVRGLR
jgi:hypothetical protein